MFDSSPEAPRLAMHAYSCTRLVVCAPSARASKIAFRRWRARHSGVAGRGGSGRRPPSRRWSDACHAWGFWRSAGELAVLGGAAHRRDCRADRLPDHRRPGGGPRAGGHRHLTVTDWCAYDRTRRPLTGAYLRDAGRPRLLITLERGERGDRPRRDERVLVERPRGHESSEVAGLLVGVHASGVPARRLCIERTRAAASAASMPIAVT